MTDFFSQVYLELVSLCLTLVNGIGLVHFEINFWYVLAYLVHFEINFWYVLAYLKGIQDVGVFVSTEFSILTFFGQTVVVC